MYRLPLIRETISQAIAFNGRGHQVMGQRARVLGQSIYTMCFFMHSVNAAGNEGIRQESYRKAWSDNTEPNPI